MKALQVSYAQKVKFGAEDGTLTTSSFDPKATEALDMPQYGQNDIGYEKGMIDRDTQFNMAKVSWAMSR
jgi:acyl CoA:acetate/3-ketoacid CoA transferase beta subunit